MVRARTFCLAVGGTCRAQALPGDPYRLAINGSGSSTSSAHRETAASATPDLSARPPLPERAQRPAGEVTPVA
jgi:hypothetical protein